MLNTTSFSTKNVFIKSIVSRMPTGLRRLILMSSLIAYLTNTTKPEKEFIRNMDEALKLSRGGDAAIQFPVRLSRIFWGHQEVFQEEVAVLLNQSSTLDAKQQAAATIVSNIPDWFVSGSVKATIDDIVRYFDLSTRSNGLQLTH